MVNLYPAIEPYASGTLSVSPLHSLYYEECGHPQGKPVVFLHGGPGGGCIPSYRQYFDPQVWRIILFDQRGCGRSTPVGELQDNTTWDLVADIERLRLHLGIDQWWVFGGSWGSTLALAYSQTHPQSCLGLILRGIFLLRHQEIQWFYQQGASYIYPDAWEAFLEPIPAEEQDDLVKAYYQRLVQGDPETQRRAAKAWATWEGATSRLIPDPNVVESYGREGFSWVFARIECHYFYHRGFFDHDDQLLRHVDRIRHLPAVIVQGRYDVVCPMRSAWDLHRAWPEAELVIVTDAGHSVAERGITEALLAATRRFGQL
ncbi:MAG: prolyl aminopeptidase [Synechococcales cyanobacterium]